MHEVPDSNGFIYEFGKFVLDPRERVLFSNGHPVHLTDKVFDTLLLLIRHHGRPVTSDEMMASMWGESFAEEGNMTKNISRLSRILNADDEPAMESPPNTGYRFPGRVRV